MTIRQDQTRGDDESGGHAGTRSGVIQGAGCKDTDLNNALRGQGEAFCPGSVGGHVLIESTKVLVDLRAKGTRFYTNPEPPKTIWARQLR